MENDQVAEIKQMRDGGMSVAAIATEMGLSEGTVRSALGPTKKAQPGEAGYSLDEILERYRQGDPIVSILGAYDLTYARFYKILVDANEPIRKVANAGAKERRLDEAVSLYEEGMPVFDIVEATGISQPTLHAEIHKREIPLRRPRK